MKNTIIKGVAFLLFSILCIGAFGMIDVHSIAAEIHEKLTLENVVYANVAIGAIAQRDRQVFNSLKRKFGGLIPSPSYLRIEQVLSNSSGKYEFRFKRTNTEKVQEVKLEQNDVFVCTDLAVYLDCADTTKEGKSVLQTFVNQQVFPAVTGFTPAHLETLYNGKLSLKVGQVNHIEAISMQEFRYVPETQQSGETNLSEYNVKDAKYSLGSLLFLKGDSDIIVTVEFPTYSSMQIAAITSDTEHRLVFHPYGYLIRNAAK